MPWHALKKKTLMSTRAAHSSKTVRSLWFRSIVPILWHVTYIYIYIYIYTYTYTHTHFCTLYLSLGETNIVNNLDSLATSYLLPALWTSLNYLSKWPHWSLSSFSRIWRCKSMCETRLHVSVGSGLWINLNRWWRGSPAQIYHISYTHIYIYNIIV